MADLPFSYAHLWDQIYKGIDQQGPYYTVSYLFDDWADSDNVANTLTGYTTRVGGVTNRFAPHQFPLSPNLFCTDVQIEGLGRPVLNSQGRLDYNGGFIAKATYRCATYVPQGQAQVDPSGYHNIDQATPILWATQELDFETEEYVHESNQYTWSTGDSLNGKPTGIPIKVSLGVTTMNITFHRLPYLPMSVIRSKRNKINSSSFLGASAYTILFVGGRTVREISTDGSIVQKVQLVFKERDQDWRKFLRKDKLQWDLITDASSNYVFDSTDLTPLIQL